MRFKLPSILILSLSLTACGTDVSRPVLHCPPLKEYTPAKQAAVAQEKVEAEQAHKAWPDMIDDYGQMRAECRAISH